MITHHHKKPNSTETIVKDSEGEWNGAAATSTVVPNGSNNGEGADTVLVADENININQPMASSSSPVLGTLPFAVLIFYSVSGGPFGIEECVKSGGAYYALVGFLVFPFVWSLQEALITAELSAAFPHSSGGVRWCDEAFGPGVAWIQGSLSYIAGVTDNAIYPALFLDYLFEAEDSSADGDDNNHLMMQPLPKFIMLSSFVIVLAYLNYRGLDVVGKFSIAICFIAMSPFIAFAIFGAHKVDHNKWFAGPSLTVEEYEESGDYSLGGGFFPNAQIGGILLRPYLNNMFWNLNSFDSAGAFSEDLGAEPGKVLPRGMAIAFVMIMLGYLVPLAVATGVSNGTQADWNEGHMAAVTKETIGPWLGDWVVLAAGISNLALFQAEMSADSFQLMGMARSGFVPSFLGIRSRFGTPTYSIIAGTCIIILFSLLPLDKLIEMLNFNYALSLLMEYGAFFALRIKRPHVPRPFQVPLSTTGCFILMAPSMLLILTCILLSAYNTMLMSLTSICASLFLYVFYVKKDDTQLTAVEAEEVEFIPMLKAKQSSDDLVEDP